MRIGVAIVKIHKGQRGQIQPADKLYCHFPGVQLLCGYHCLKDCRVLSIPSVVHPLAARPEKARHGSDAEEALTLTNF